MSHILVEGVNVGKIDETLELFKQKPKRKIPRFDKESDLEDLNSEYLKMLESIHDSVNSNISIREGQIVEGVIEYITRREIVININYKDCVYVDNKVSDLKIIENLKPGDKIDVIITEIIDNPYQIKGSITDLIRMKVSTKLKECFNSNLSLSAKVTELIPAGYLLSIDMDNIIISAFMPNTLAGVNRLHDPNSLIDQRIDVMLETLQQEKGYYVVSRRKYLNSRIPEEIKKLKRDEVYTGHVTGTTPFGVFVEFNECLTGMIHKMNIDEKYHDMLEKIPAGTKIDFYVRDILRGNKLILSQYLRESLWDKIKVGKIIEGKVKVVKEFGALISLDEETMGLIQNVYLKDTKLTEGETIKVKVISVIKDDRKIYLSPFKEDK